MKFNIFRRESPEFLRDQNEFSFNLLSPATRNLVAKQCCLSSFSTEILHNVPKFPLSRFVLIACHIFYENFQRKLAFLMKLNVEWGSKAGCLVCGDQMQPKFRFIKWSVASVYDYLHCLPHSTSQWRKGWVIANEPSHGIKFRIWKEDWEQNSNPTHHQPRLIYRLRRTASSAVTPYSCQWARLDIFSESGALHYCHTGASHSLHPRRSDGE